MFLKPNGLPVVRLHSIMRLQSHWTGKRTHQKKVFITKSLHIRATWALYNKSSAWNMLHMQIECLIIGSLSVSWREDIQTEGKKRGAVFTLWVPGLLEFEVLLFDLNQQCAEHGLYWLLWPTSVWHSLPETYLSLTPITSPYALDTGRVQTCLCWSICREKNGCLCCTTQLRVCFWKFISAILFFSYTTGNCFI